MNLLTIFLSALLILLVSTTTVRNKHVRWHVPEVNNRTCARETCLVTKPFTLSTKVRATHLNLAQYIFASDVVIINDHITHISPPRALHRAPQQKVIIRTRISHVTAMRLRKVFTGPEVDILGQNECRVFKSIPKGCHFVIGDLRIESDFVLPKGEDEWIERIDGCLYITNTNFSNDDLQFLNGYVHNYIPCGLSKSGFFQRMINNRNLCAPQLFPALVVNEDPYCGKKKWYFEPEVVEALIVMAATLLCVVSHFPMVFLVNRNRRIRYWEEVEQDIIDCDDYFQAREIWKEEREARRRNKQTAGNKKALEPKPKPPRRTEAEEKFREQEMTARLFTADLMVWTFHILTCSLILIVAGVCYAHYFS